MFIFKPANLEIVKPRLVGKTIRTKRDSDSFRQFGAIIGLKIKAVFKRRSRRSRQNKTQKQNKKLQRRNQAVSGIRGNN